MRTHVSLPDDLVQEIDSIVGKRGRSAFLAAAARNRLERLHLLDVLDQTAGSWDPAQHAELEAGAAAWVRGLRDTDEQLDEDRRGRLSP